MTNRLLLWLAWLFAGGLMVLAALSLSVTRKLVTAPIFSAVILLGKFVPDALFPHLYGPLDTKLALAVTPVVWADGWPRW